MPVSHPTHTPFIFVSLAPAPASASYPGASLLDMGAQGRKGRRKEERRLADFVFKMAESVMADDYAIFKNEFRPVNLAFLEEKIVCPHPSCEGEAVFFQKNGLQQHYRLRQPETSF